MLKLKHEDIISSHSIISEKSENKKSEKEDKEAKNNIYLTDNEKYEDMDYDEALHNDKRNFYQIYKSFLFEEHIIFNTGIKNNKNQLFIFWICNKFFLKCYFLHR